MQQENKPLWEKLKTIPESPGIYQMLDIKGHIIYIGKSKCLKKRVHSYFVESPKWDKAKKMAPFIYDINYIVTDTHIEAMLLECEMIKSKKPYFNVLMKNDKRYVYLNVASPVNRKVSKSGFRREKLLTVTYERGEISFGPFRRRNHLQEFVDSMENLYPFVGKRGEKFQFEYHFFPVKLTEAEWNETRKLLEKLFRSAAVMEQFQNSLEKKMREAAKQQKFETALKYRNLNEFADSIKKNLRQYGNWMNQELIYIENASKGKKAFYIRNGLVISKQMLDVSDRLDDAQTILLKTAELAHRSESESENKSEDKPEIRPENRSEDKSENRSEDKPENMSEDKPENKPENKSEDRPEIRSETRRTEKEMIDFQDIVYAELAKAEDWQIIILGKE